MAPVYTIRRHFLNIDRKVMYGLLKNSRNIQCTEGVFNGLFKSHFESVFNLPRHKHNAYPTYMVETDGYTASFHFEYGEKRYTKKAEKMAATSSSESHTDSVTADDANGTKYIGIDPGRTNIVYAVKDQSTYCLTRRQMYHESGYTARKRSTDAWRARNAGMLTELSKSTPKTSRLDAFDKYMTSVSKNKRT